MSLEATHLAEYSSGHPEMVLDADEYHSMVRAPYVQYILQTAFSVQLQRPLREAGWLSGLAQSWLQG